MVSLQQIPNPTPNRNRNPNPNPGNKSIQFLLIAFYAGNDTIVTL